MFHDFTEICRFTFIYACINYKHAKSNIKMLEYGIRHREFIIELYKIQMESGLYFLHEHPHGASSWQTPAMQEFILKNSVHLGVGHMCRHGMKVGGKLVYKPARWLSNGRLIVEALALRCSGDHEHGRLFGGTRSRRAQIYLTLLCQHIMQGFVK